ncbi:hypothetical protein LOC68_04365 [Blastopirellula sp. JC732]|uniref:Uncharacterized protein n=2 Tax=Blastopirellula sediminis TaxID=2894196 RepID=A0A9X1MJE5_9BACT|nr:hypothetical protein [Blastopirellula sediminis]
MIELALSIHDLPNRDYEKTVALRAKAAQHFGSILAEYQTEAAKHNLDETQQWFVKTRFPHLIDEAQHNPLGLGTCYGILLTETETSELKRLLTATLTPVEHKNMFQLGGDMNKNGFFLQGDAFNKVWFHIIHCEQSRLMAKTRTVLPSDQLGRLYQIFNDKKNAAEEAESAARRKQFLEQVERETPESDPVERKRQTQLKERQR